MLVLLRSRFCLLPNFPTRLALRIDRQLLKSRVTIPCSGRTSTSPRFRENCGVQREALQQIQTALAKFDEFTLTVSKREPQITLAIPIYYELHDMLNDAASMLGEFSDLDTDIALAVSVALRKYQKYYDFMDGQDAYYIALVLDHRFKTLLLEKELGVSVAATVICHLKEVLHQQYPATTELPNTRQGPIVTGQTIEARVLQKLQPQKRNLSDIDLYFERGLVSGPRRRRRL
ncbi:hypothetical protein V1515DRAFT_589045 [Lipomyces mesembrius]